MDCGFREFEPHPALVRYVDRFWARSSGPSADGGPRRILPDGCIDLIVDVTDRWKAVVVGAMTRATQFEPQAPTRLIAARFRSGGAIPFLTVAAHEITDHVVDSGDLGLRWLAPMPFEARTELPAAVRALERLLLQRLAATAPPNQVVAHIDGAVEDPHLWPSTGDSHGKSDAIQTELLEACDAVLMGRRTYEAFAAVWPTRRGDRYSERINAMPKYVVSTTLRDPAWANATLISGNVPEELARLRQRPGKDIVQYGFGPVTYTLLEHGLLDELRLWVHPLILGREGPALPHFRECPSAQFRFLDSATLPNGIAILRYGVKREP